MIPNTRTLLTSKLKWLIENNSDTIKNVFSIIMLVLKSGFIHSSCQQKTRLFAHQLTQWIRVRPAAAIVVLLCSPCRGWDEEPTRPHLSFLANQFSHRRQLQLLSSSISQLPPPRPRRRFISSDHYLCHHTAPCGPQQPPLLSLNCWAFRYVYTGGYHVCKE